MRNATDKLNSRDLLEYACRWHRRSAKTGLRHGLPAALKTRLKVYLCVGNHAHNCFVHAIARPTAWQRLASRIPQQSHERKDLLFSTRSKQEPIRRRELIRERTGEGRKRAQAAGVKFGRKPKAVSTRKGHQATGCWRTADGYSCELRRRYQHDLAADVIEFESARIG
jgi:hypothetical protein